MKKSVVVLLAFLFLTGCASGLGPAGSDGAKEAMSAAVADASTGVPDWAAEQKMRYDINSQDTPV